MFTVVLLLVIAVQPLVLLRYDIDFKVDIYLLPTLKLPHVLLITFSKKNC